MYKKLRDKKKKINIGIQLLRMISCLIIIHIHYYSYYSKIVQNFLYAIMTFFVISFYFSFNVLSSRKSDKIKERFKRMLIPYIGWPLIIVIYDIYAHKKIIYSFKQLYYQILFGCGVYGIFWFLFDVLLLSLFITLINYIFKKYSIFILFIICVLDYLFFYSGNASNIIFKKFLKVPARHSIQPMFEFFIFVFSGYYCGSINIINKLKKHRIKSIIISFSIIFVFFKYFYFIFRRVTFLYKGFVQNIFIFNIFIFFSMIPFDKIRNKCIINILNKLTSYTGGVYYLHVKVGDFYRRQKHSKIDFKDCLMIYLYCFFICLIGNIVLKKFSLKYLFI